MLQGQTPFLALPRVHLSGVWGEGGGDGMTQVFGEAGARLRAQDYAWAVSAVLSRMWSMRDEAAQEFLPNGTHIGHLTLALAAPAASHACRRRRLPCLPLYLTSTWSQGPRPLRYASGPRAPSAAGHGVEASGIMLGA